MRVERTIEGFSGSVRDSPKRISHFFHKLYNGAAGQQTYNISKGFEDWISANRLQSCELAMLIKNGGQDSPFLGFILLAWREIAPSDALDATIDFSYDDRTNIKRQAIYSLGLFKYGDENEASKAEARLVEAVLSSENTHRITALSAITHQLKIQQEKSARLTELVGSLTDTTDKEIRHELIQGFTLHQGAYTPSIQSKVISLMKTVGLDCIETLDVIDHAFYTMDIDKQRDTVFETLTAILSQKDMAPQLTVFDMLMDKIANAPHELIGWYVTRWLLDGDYNICSQISSVFAPFDDSIYEFKLGSFALKPAEIFYLVRKIYVYLMFSHGPAVSFLSECLLLLDVSDRIHLEDDISSFWLRNYPNDIDLFDKVHDTHKNQELKSSIERMRQRVESYENPLRSQPLNAALKPSTMERRIQAEIAHVRNKEMHKAAEKKSIFASMMHKSTLLYGNSSVTYIYTTPTDEPVRQVVPLKSFTTSTTLPRMDTLYPARLNYLLYRFRLESRPK